MRKKQRQEQEQSSQFNLNTTGSTNICLTARPLWMAGSQADKAVMACNASSSQPAPMPFNTFDSRTCPVWSTMNWIYTLPSMPILLAFVGYFPARDLPTSSYRLGKPPL